MTLGVLIKTLEALPPSMVLRRGFADPHSYRGAYSELAFVPKDNCSVSDMMTSTNPPIDLWLDDIRDPRDYVVGGDHYVRCHTAQSAIAILASTPVRHLSLDHDLGLCMECRNRPFREVNPTLLHAPQAMGYWSCPHVGTGMDVVQWMVSNRYRPTGTVTIHSANSERAAAMWVLFPDAVVLPAQKQKECNHECE